MTKTDMVELTVKAINAYCRVLELHMKAIAQGANPLTTATSTGEYSAGSKVVNDAMEGLIREVSFLRFLREDQE